VAKLNTELVKAAKLPDIAECMASDGGEPLGTTPEQFRQHLMDEIARWRKVVLVAGIRVE
jgi:tripartite-type tricarboxylate transporter receptor subunit TctC